MSLKLFLRTKKIEILLFFLLIIGLGLKLYRLDNPNSYYFDEIYYAFTAQEMAKGNRAGWEIGHTAPQGFAYEWSHPHLGKELSAIGILIFGDNTFGWRFFQALFGGFGTLFIYLLGKELFLSKRAGLIAAFLFTFESFIFVLSRIAMVDIFLMSFILLASLFLVKYARTPKIAFLLLSGFFCGAAISVKWSGIYALEFLAASSFLLIFYREAYSEIGKKGSFYFQFVKIIPKIFLVFVVIPFVVYLATYIPFFLYGNSFSDFISLQNNMYGYHKGLTATHPYQSSWWKWPLLLRPVYLYLGSGKEESAHIYAIGNPFIWWSGCVFLILSVVQVIRKELPALAFVTLSVFAYWLPWALSPRKLVFLYHFLASLPFVILIIAYFLDLLWSKSYYGRAFVLVYLAIALGMFIYFYPILAAVPVSNVSVESFFWLKSWR
ncbi:MAG TPA: phospholipid carrier-dependent glycosyltransferase [Thermodesulfobacteriota bacterium]|nr:phospholipid carrier-dependent glycosyltransferase [Thermodesulfobacteriota bacterium]